MGIIDDLKLEYRSGGVVQRLMFWNVGLFIFPLLIFSIFGTNGYFWPELDWRVGGAMNWFSLSPYPEDLLWKPWSLFTYAFLHSDVEHILFNILALYFSGRLFLTFFTQKQFFGLYTLAAIFAGAIFVVGHSFIPVLNVIHLPLVGASAAIMAILIASAVYAPDYEVSLFFILRVKLMYVALGFVIIDLIYVTAENTGGHIAHLSGALLGFVYIKLLKNGTDLSVGVSVVLDFFANLFKPRKSAPFKKVHRNTAPPQRNTAKTGDMTQKQIDVILDKISQSGYDSLTKEEKEFLFKVGK